MGLAPILAQFMLLMHHCQQPNNAQFNSRNITYQGKEVAVNPLTG